MPEIQIIAKASHAILSTTTAATTKLTEASVVLVKVPSTDVKSVLRDGTNAVVELKNGEKIIIRNIKNMKMNEITQDTVKVKDVLIFRKIME